MGRSLKIARIRGIDVRLHATFPLIVIWAAVEWGLGTTFSPFDALYGVLLVLLLFVCVVLHELGHSLVAVRFGVDVRDITLLPIGGVAQMRRMPSRPSQELGVAIAGPAVNLAIAAVLGLAVWALSLLDPTFSFGEALRLMLVPSARGVLLYLMAANLGMALFNLLPAFPMDGGRILRAVLAMTAGPRRATPIAARVGQVLSAGFVLLGLYFTSPFTMLIGVFIFAGAMGELRAARTQHALDGLTVGDLVGESRAPLLDANQPLGSVTQLAVFNAEPNFPVLEQGVVRGVLHIPDLNQALREHGPWAPVRAAMVGDMPAVQAAESLHDVEQLMAEQGRDTVQVYDGTNFRGVLSYQQIAQQYARLQAPRTRRTPNIRTLPPAVTKKPL